MALLEVNAGSGAYSPRTRKYVFILYLVPKHQDALLRISGHYWTHRCLAQKVVPSQ